MVIYSAIFILLAILSFIELFTIDKKRINFLFSVPILIIFLVLTALRGGTRGDYITYKEVYEYMVDTSVLFTRVNFQYEPLYSILQWLCKNITENFQIFLLIIGLIVIFFEYKFAKTFSARELVKDNKHKSGSYYFTIFFVLWGLYLSSIFVIRSTISLVICFYSVQFVKNRDFKRFAACIILATGFHYSALIFFPAYFIFHFKSKLSTKLLIFVLVSIFFSVSIHPVALMFAKLVGGTLGKRIDRYLSATDFMAGTGMSNGTMFLVKALLNIGVILIVAIYFWNFNKNNKEYEGYFNLYIVGCILYIATLNVGLAFARLSIYYNIFQVPLLMYVFKGYSKGNNNRLIYWIVFVMYIAARFFVNNIDEPFIAYWQ